MKKALITRLGAYGDVIMITPVIKWLKDSYYHVTVYTGDRGIAVLKNNPHIDEIIRYDKEGSHNPDIDADIERVKKEVNADWYCDFSESIEVNLAKHPKSPYYVYEKALRKDTSDVNYYEETFRWAKIPQYTVKSFNPELFFTDEEIIEAKKYIKPDKFNILWALSGSGCNKVYPWFDYVIGEILNNNKNVHFITVGDEKCKILEVHQKDQFDEENITNLSGNVGFRASMALSNLASLVVSPDTGVLHAAGSCSVPKIGILGHTTIENITKHFENDFSLEPEQEFCECAPCFRLIYDHKIQCPVDHLTGAAWCMAYGQPAQRLADQIQKVINGEESERNSKEYAWAKR